jgi:NADPH-dependent glutamate synthase beta subunit-like oxidoreductase/Pyruvate/2-oxoacid:ferredoxin oxidoreductase delta subunit
MESSPQHARNPAQPVDKVREFLHEKGVTLQFPELSASFPIQEVTTSSCRVACPAGVNIKAYLGAIARRDFERALEIVKETNPLPGICGRVCTHPCEAECRRGEFDEPIAICALKRFIADYELSHGTKEITPIPRTKEDKIAIIGSGPAGLTAANDLVRMGYAVTIFEELPVAGGMLITGIPAYRLPRNVIEKEIDDIAQLGVEIKTNTKVESLDGLFKKGYKAVFLAIGAHKGLKLRVPGEDEFEGIVDCIQYLRKVNAGEIKTLGNRVLVIGGGNSAIDSARSAVRLGCGDVHIVYRRSRKEMPANEDEVIEAENEGVKIDYLAAPVKIIGKDGKAVGMECVRMQLGEPDASGRRRPVPIEGSEFTLEADLIISAISQKPDVECFRGSGLNITKWDSFEVDEHTLQTNRPGVFAGGDAVTGPSTVIDAIAAGHGAARSIDRYLREVPLVQDEEENMELIQHIIEPAQYTLEKAKRIHAEKLPVEKRQGSFREVENVLTEDQAVAEAKRCLRCGPCFECIHCVKECRKRVVGITTDKGKELLMVHGLPDDMKLSETVRGMISVKGKGSAEIKIEPIVSEVNEEMCRGCGECEKVCDYTAITVQERADGERIAQVDISVCKGCGTCVSVCPTGAAHLRFFKEKDIDSELKEFLR